MTLIVLLIFMLIIHFIILFYIHLRIKVSDSFSCYLLHFVYHNDEAHDAI